jgi:hypothetical protein
MIKRRQKGEDFEKWHLKKIVCVSLTDQAIKLMEAKMHKHPRVWYNKSHFVECAIRRQASLNIERRKP